jgi:hypothetical protein
MPHRARDTKAEAQTKIPASLPGFAFLVSLPGLTRLRAEAPSARRRPGNPSSLKKMDARIKSAHDGCCWRKRLLTR